MEDKDDLGEGGGGIIDRGIDYGDYGMEIGGKDEEISQDFDKEDIKMGEGEGLVMGGIGNDEGKEIGDGERKIGDVFDQKQDEKEDEMVKQELRYIKKDEISDGIDEKEIKKSIDEIGKEEMMMDIQKNLKGEEGEIEKRKGEEKKIIRDEMKKRMEGENKRVVRGIDEEIGKVEKKREIEEKIRYGKRDIDYGENLRNYREVNKEKIEKGMESEYVKMSGKEKREENDVRKMLNIKGKDKIEKNKGKLFKKRKEIEGMIENEKKKKDVEILDDKRKKIDSVIDEKVKGIKMEDEKFKEIDRKNEGIRMGVKEIDSGSEELSNDEIRKEIVEGVKKEGMMVGKQEKKLRMKKEERDEIDRKVGKKENEVVELKKVIKGEGEWKRERIGMMLGKERDDKDMRIIEREERLEKKNNDVNGKRFKDERSEEKKEILKRDD